MRAGPSDGLVSRKPDALPKRVLVLEEWRGRGCSFEGEKRSNWRGVAWRSLEEARGRNFGEVRGTDCASEGVSMECTEEEEPVQ